MLNPFPELLTYSLLAPFIIRLAVGFVFLNLGILTIKGERDVWQNSIKALGIPNPKRVTQILAIIQILGGLLLIIGLYTQIAALILGILSLAETYIEYKESSILKRELFFYILLFVSTISLLLSGAGAFAIDIPL